MKATTCFLLGLILLFASGNSPLLFAQGTDLGTIAGSVTDSSGAMVPNAKVVILDLATNTPRETTTNGQGEYRVFGLRPGAYKVTVSAQGMGTAQISGIQLTGRDPGNA